MLRCASMAGPMERSGLGGGLLQGPGALLKAKLSRALPQRLPSLQLEPLPASPTPSEERQLPHKHRSSSSAAKPRKSKRETSLARSVASASTSSGSSSRSPSPSHSLGSARSCEEHACGGGAKGLRQLRRSLSLSFACTTPSTRSTPTLSPGSSSSVGGLRPIGSSAEFKCVITEWKRGNQIGAGSFGCVFKAQDQASGLIFAVKQAAVSDSSKDAEKLQVEIDICASLRHPNIVSYLGCAQRDGSLCIFLEYVPGGSMAAVLATFGALNSRLLMQATQDCLEGLHYLHSRSVPVVHRDLKCANLLVDLDFRVKLADFGCSKQSASTKSFSTVGSIPWMAPEVIQGDVGYGRKADIWGLGCTLLEMATAEKPWGDAKFSNIMQAMRIIAMTEELPTIPEGVPGWCRELIARCVCREVSSRPGTAALLRLLPTLPCAQ
mmetsp:Transcript_144102/g.461314  ORF Transcript_144102/g.461314 Transcript_144102/m.461314 type:complete len:437 (-) Transcript_144102:157-1467(-)